MAKHAKRKQIPAKYRRGALVAGAATLAAIAGPQLLNLAEAADSTPVPPNVDPLAQDVTVQDGTTVRIAAPSLRLTVAVDKPVVTSGSTITYTYTLANTGNTAYRASSVRLTDDRCEPPNGFVWTGNAGDPALLDVGETWKTTCQTTVLKDQTNAARVTATPVLTDAVPTSTPSSTATPTPTAAGYKDGTYLGTLEHVTVPGENVAYDMQVQAVIAGGRITAITVPTHTETDTTSRNIFRFQVATTASLNTSADASNPTMIWEALAAQSASIATISGATYTTGGFTRSLAAALTAAKA